MFLVLFIPKLASQLNSARSVPLNFIKSASDLIIFR